MTTSGIARQVTTSGIRRYATTSGIARYETTFGIRRHATSKPARLGPMSMTALSGMTFAVATPRTEQSSTTRGPRNPAADRPASPLTSPAAEAYVAVIRPVSSPPLLTLQALGSIMMCRHRPPAQSAYPNQ